MKNRWIFLSLNSVLMVLLKLSSVVIPNITQNFEWLAFVVAQETLQAQQNLSTITCGK